MKYVITIARGFGSGGKEVAYKLSKKLGIPYYENQILDFAAEQSGISKDKFAKVDELIKGNYLTNFLRRQPVKLEIEPTECEFMKDDRVLFQIQSEVIQRLAQTESCIIVGKCADYILKENKNVVSIYVEAPRFACVNTVMEKLHVSEKRANELIRKTDKYRANYYHYYTMGEEWTNPINYDLVMNSYRIGIDNCVETIIGHLKVKFGENFNDIIS